MNLLSLQVRDYEYSCQPLIGIDDEKFGLFMHCHAINDTDSYLMDWSETKTLHDNCERLLKALKKGLQKDE